MGRKAKAKRPCSFGEIYCVKCRTPQTPAGNVADYLDSGMLRGVCPACGTLIYKRVSSAKLDLIRSQLQVRLPKALQHIRETRSPSVICASSKAGESDGDN